MTKEHVWETHARQTYARNYEEYARSFAAASNKATKSKYDRSFVLLNHFDAKEQWKR